VNIMQLMLPEGDWKVLCAAGCATVVGAGAGAGAVVTVTVTVGADGGVGAARGADGDVDSDVAGLSGVAWTAVEPAEDEHPATASAASATSHA
jgi:hypothetical protein